MKTFHIVWFEKPIDIYSTGVNIEAIDEVEALTTWKEKHPNVIFHSMSTKCDIPEIELNLEE